MNLTVTCRILVIIVTDALGRTAEFQQLAEERAEKVRLLHDAVSVLYRALFPHVW